LKKAFTDEQSKNNELRDGLKEKDQSVRKLEQEVESLNFRNQQLAKRIGVLQEELSLINNVNHTTNKKSKNKHSTPTHNNSTDNSVDNNILDVLNMELKNKITENEKLHLKLNGIEMDYISRIDEMQKQLDLIKSETEFKQKSITESLDSRQTIINKLNAEKERLESKLQICQKESQEAKILAENL
jgi:protein phosphatase 1 regulatory subunit 21